MNGRSKFATITQLIRDTFRQAWASGIFWMMLAVTFLCVSLCLSVNVSQDAVLHSPDETTFFLPRPAPGFETNPAKARNEGVETISGSMTLAFGAVTIPIGRE